MQQIIKFVIWQPKSKRYAKELKNCSFVNTFGYKLADYEFHLPF
jgi:hypothetical protein